jgi:hypothetical protein
VCSMSLFQAREWWSTKVDSDEVFEGAAFAVGNIDNEPGGQGECVKAVFWLCLDASPSPLSTDDPRHSEDSNGEFAGDATTLLPSTTEL